MAGAIHPRGFAPRPLTGLRTGRAAGDEPLKHKIIDETGKRYTHLRVIRRLENTPQNQACWLCECDCGNKKEITGVSLRRGNQKSCGCKRNESIGYRFKNGGRISLSLLTRIEEEDFPE
jgi:hypothetical protein